MKALGKINNIEVGYQAEKTSQTDGHKYWGERYTIYFESGDDIHMVDSGWLHCAGKNGGAVLLAKRGIRIGNRGEMTIRYGFRDYNGRRYPECELVRFDSMEASNVTPNPANKADAQASADHAILEELMADAAVEAEKNGDLPF